MFRATLGLFVAGFLWVSTPTPSAAAPVCGERSEIFGQLESRHGETPHAIAITGDGKLIEVLVSPTGDWSLLMTHPRGPTCVIAVGDSWENIVVTAGQPA